MRLVAGVDPGTAVGWAVFGLDGRLVKSGSQKHLSLDALVALLSPFGKIIAVGTDRAKIPSFVQLAATKLGARVFSPAFDLLVEEKRVLASQQNFNDSHEMDALACGLFALRKMQPLISKVRSFLSREKRLGLFDEMVELVLREGISIRSALSILSPTPEKIVAEVAEETPRNVDIVKLYGALSSARKDNYALSAHNSELKKKLHSLEQSMDSLRGKMEGLVRPKSSSEVTRLKDSQIDSLAQRLRNSQFELVSLRGKVSRAEKALLRRGVIALPRLKRLGWDDVSAVVDFVDSVVFVHDANQISAKAVGLLKEKGVELVVCEKLPGRSARESLPFACVQSSDHELLDFVVLLDKNWLDRVRSDKLVLARVVEEYKKQRSNV